MTKDKILIIGVTLLVLLVGITYVVFSRSHGKTMAAATTTTYDAFDQEHIAKLAAIRPGCADTYKAVLAHTNTNATDPSNFTVARPLADYTCGQFSDIKTLPLTDGKIIYFVVTDTYTDCGAGGCWYSAFLEEKPGLVIQLQGFDGYQLNDTGPTLSPHPQGQVFGVLSINKTNNMVRVKEVSWCGPYMENVYQAVNDHLTLIASYEYKNDGCIDAPATTIFRNTNIDKSLTAPSA
jgi:hypothetical protein